MAVIDIHAHVYPDKIAERASQSVGEFYHVGMYEGGSVEALLSATTTSPITHFVVHSVATKPGNVESINDFIAEQCRIHPEFIGFATLHQDYPTPRTEIERAMGLGLKGLKLHPDTQQVDMDDPRLMRIYEMIEGRLPLIVHTGDYRYDYSHPRRLKKVLHALPEPGGGRGALRRLVGVRPGRGIPGRTTNCFLDMSELARVSGRAPHGRSWCACAAPTASCSARTSPCGAPRRNTKTSRRSTSPKRELENMTWHNAERFLNMKVE